MAKFYDSINPKVQEFINNQKIFFVATAAEEGRVNLSPKGMDTLRVLNENRVMWLNLTGSGNETAAHLLQVNRITIMLCSFEEKPLILRLYGKAKMYQSDDKEWSEHIHLFPELAGSRQIFDIEIESVQTSCGFAVPFMEFKGERTQLVSSSEKKGEEKIKEYWKEKNSMSIDGFPTGI